MTRMLLAGMLILGSLTAARSQELPNGIRAGIEAYQNAEAQRRAAVGEQIDLNAAMRQRMPWSAPYGEVIYYPRAYVAPPVYSYSEYGYRSSRGVFRGNVSFGAASWQGGWGPFSSTYLGVSGYVTPLPKIRQPVGQRQTLTGPRRWESHPIFADDERWEEPLPEPIEPRRGPREF